MKGNMNVKKTRNLKLLGPRSIRLDSKKKKIETNTLRARDSTMIIPRNNNIQRCKL